MSMSMSMSMSNRIRIRNRNRNRNRVGMTCLLVGCILFVRRVLTGFFFRRYVTSERSDIAILAWVLVALVCDFASKIIYLHKYATTAMHKYELRKYPLMLEAFTKVDQILLPATTLSLL